MGFLGIGKKRKPRTIIRYVDRGPTRPKYNSLLDGGGKYGNTGLLRAPYRLEAGPTIQYGDDIVADERGLDAFRNEALREGPSAWAELMNKNQGIQEGISRDRTMNTMASQGALAEARLASRGGLSEGARERIALQGSRDLYGGMQDVARQGELDRLGIATADEEKRMQALSQLPGMEIQALEPQFRNRQMRLETGFKNRQFDVDSRRFNIEQAINENRNQHLHALELYKEQMRDRAAGKQADATIASSKKGKK